MRLHYQRIFEYVAADSSVSLRLMLLDLGSLGVLGGSIGVPGSLWLMWFSPDRLTKPRDSAKYDREH
jgi:hypothetical protein